MAEQNIIRRIHKLPDFLVNQISAGEVIERPASVVKELLENSIDAGATKISVEIKGGGSRLIRVNDNGHGIHKDDLLLAIDRHSTSKLDSKSNLHRIVTLGFRGEALSSIASVSKLTITSSLKNSDHGWTVNPELSHVPRPAPHPPGTTVEARSLFFNTPARRKFLRSDRTETIHIQELVKRICLSRFNLAMKLTLDGREVLILHDDNDSPEHRVTTILGRKFIQNSLVLEQQLDGMYLHGWTGKPEIARSQTDQQFIYLNGRIIKDKLINHAVRMAYDDLLYSGRHPAYLLYLQMDHEAADINVHPTKHEVRFRDARKVHDFIYSSLASVIQQKLTVASSQAGYFTVGEDSKSLPVEHYQVKDEPENFIKINDTENEDRKKFLFGVPVAQIKGQYLITEVPSGIFLHDVYRMREIIARIRLEDEFKSGEINSRPVLVPLVLPISSGNPDVLENYSEMLQKTGLVFRQISREKIQIRDLPLLIPFADPVELAKDVIGLLEHKKTSDSLTEQLFQILSRHANDNPPVNLNLREMNLLLTEFYGLKDRITNNVFGHAIRAIDMNMLKEIINGKY